MADSFVYFFGYVIEANIGGGIFHGKGYRIVGVKLTKNTLLHWITFNCYPMENFYSIGLDRLKFKINT